MAIRLHMIQEGDDLTALQVLYPTRGNAIVKKPNNTNYDLLLGGDHFDLSVPDTQHNVIWYRDTCPIDQYITAFVGALPSWTQTSLQAHSALAGYELVIAVWDDLFSQAFT